MSASHDRIYVLLSRDQLERAARTGQYVPDDFAVEGFLHASPPDQLERVANKFYRGVVDLRLLHIDPSRVTAEIRWEPAAGGLYPHLYGPLNMDAVVQTTTVPRDADGQLLPEDEVKRIFSPNFLPDKA